ncbi:hypothetical protein D9756_009989 [Leucocoprinus leucothites]|uniref:NACHT domain-containing protein n=1 Tax=Leucocoprinus leucothites TaxID=201217 RepID=A0A8H5FSA5_9AGAR|nr:hypothetical protein D9756_009989 [Leucoagaricus leucothites]
MNSTSSSSSSFSEGPLGPEESRILSNNESLLIPENPAGRSLDQPVSTRTKRRLSNTDEDLLPRKRAQAIEPAYVPFLTPRTLPTYNEGTSFQGARDFILKNPSFVSTTQNVYSQGHDSLEVFRWLREYIMQGAEFDSSERDPPPRCHPETRTTILQRANDWIDNLLPHEQILWIRGPAGVGKSAIVQTLVEGLSKSHRLGASLFFSRTERRSNPLQVFPTLAYQLATQDINYRTYLTELMCVNPRSLEKAMSAQFHLLILEPFARRKLREGQPHLLVAIDGLDECEGEQNQDKRGQTQLRGRNSDRVQCAIVQLISDFVRNNPSIPLLWIIASRPETHLSAVFAEDEVVGTFWEEDVPVDSDEACRDVEIFLHNEFKKIRKHYPNLITQTPWPNSGDFLQITKAASGLFVFAEVVARFIDDPQVRNPIAHLDYVLAALSRFPGNVSRQNPLAALDAIYTAILARVPAEVVETTKQLLTTIVFHQRLNISPSPLNEIRRILNLSLNDAIVALDKLPSVIYFSPSRYLDNACPRFYHASFPDFLRDRSRSHGYAVGRHVVKEKLLEVCLPGMRSE